MTTSTITTQSELDAALADTDVTEIRIKSELGVWIQLTANPGRYALCFTKPFVLTGNPRTVKSSHVAVVPGSYLVLGVCDTCRPPPQCPSAVATQASTTVMRSRYVEVRVALAGMNVISADKVKAASVECVREVDVYARPIGGAK